MKHTKLLCLLALIIVNFSCSDIIHESIKGDGTVKTEERAITTATTIKSYGSFDIEIIQGNMTSVKVETDENLLPYIITENEGSTLKIKTKDNANISSNNKIKIYVTTNKLEEVKLAGSGNITGAFISTDNLDLGIAGSGNITMAVNVPSLHASIAGSGDILLSGEAPKTEISIAGSGNYKAENLKTESTRVNTAGSGDANVSASSSLKVDIAGSGDVYYKGTPAIDQKVAGSGSVQQIK